MQSPAEKTIGVELIVNRGSRVCVIDWGDGDPQVSEVREDASNGDVAQIRSDCANAPTGVCCPFGWPVGFVHFLTDHLAGGRHEPEQWSQLTLRATDRQVTSIAKLRYGHTLTPSGSLRIMDCAFLLDELQPGLARDGTDGVIEVNPTASLRVWSGRRGHQTDAKLWQDFTSQVGPIDTDKTRAQDRTLQKVIVAAFTARAFDCGLTLPIPEAHSAAALQEGWTHLPMKGSLPTLLGRSEAPREQRGPVDEAAAQAAVSELLRLFPGASLKGEMD